MAPSGAEFHVDMIEHDFNVTVRPVIFEYAIKLIYLKGINLLGPIGT